MTTVIINNSTRKGKLILDLIREMGCGEILSDEPNEETKRAIENARTGKLTKDEKPKETKLRLTLSKIETLRKLKIFNIFS